MSDTDEINSLRSEKIESTDIDKIGMLIRKKFAKKVRAVQVGGLIGNLGDLCWNHDAEHTAMCKTDCLLLLIKHDVIEILENHRIKVQKDYVTKFFMEVMPPINRCYTQNKISEKINKIYKEIVV